MIETILSKTKMILFEHFKHIIFIQVRKKGLGVGFSFGKKILRVLEQPAGHFDLVLVTNEVRNGLVFELSRAIEHRVQRAVSTSELTVVGKL